MVTEHWIFDSSYYWTECRRHHVNNKRHSLAVRHSNYNSKNAGSNPAGVIGTGFSRKFWESILVSTNVIRRTAQYYSSSMGSNPVDINMVKSSTSEILRALFITRHHRIMEIRSQFEKHAWVRFPLVSSGAGWYFEIRSSDHSPRRVAKICEKQFAELPRTLLTRLRTSSPRRTKTVQ